MEPGLKSVIVTLVLSVLQHQLGVHCQAQKVCSTNQCLNGGTCIDTAEGWFTCQCPIGYYGTRCEQDMYECLPNPCKNGGVCTEITPPSQLGNRFNCSCQSGYSGSVCETLGSTTCFPSESHVILRDGTKLLMSQLRIGDSVLTRDEYDGTAHFSPVVAFLDHKPDAVGEYLRISTSDNTTITLSALHLIAVMEGVATEFVHARRVMLADEILVYRDGTFARQRVVAVDRVVKVGAFAPLTITGTVVVDGALASCYAVVNSHQVGHLALAPLRWWNSLKQLFTLVPGSNPNGVHVYAQLLHPIAESLQLVAPHGTL